MIRSHPSDVAWPLTQLGISPLRDAGIDGSGQVVGVIDGGIDTGHPAIEGRTAGDLSVDTVDLAVGASAPGDRTGHGTAVASVIVGRELDGVALGVAPGARIVGVDGVGRGDELARIVVGMDAAVGRGAGIVCLALGTRSFNPILATAARSLRRHGVLTLASAGNDGPGAIRSPADFREVLSVGACDRYGKVAETSGSLMVGASCKAPDVVAPGRDVRVAQTPTGTGLVSGASYATGYVAGVAALLRQARPNATVEDIHRAIVAGAGSLAADQRRRSRRGVVDAGAALDHLGSATTDFSGSSARIGVADLDRWVDPFAAELLERAGPEGELSVVVAPFAGERAGIAAALDHAEHSTGRQATTVLEQRWTGTAVIRATSPFVRQLVDAETLQIVSAPRVNLAPPSRGSVVVSDRPGEAHSRTR